MGKGSSNIATRDSDEQEGFDVKEIAGVLTESFLNLAELKEVTNKEEQRSIEEIILSYQNPFVYNFTKRDNTGGYGYREEDYDYSQLSKKIKNAEDELESILDKKSEAEDGLRRGGRDEVERDKIESELRTVLLLKEAQISCHKNITVEYPELVETMLRSELKYGVDYALLNDEHTAFKRSILERLTQRKSVLLDKEEESEKKSVDRLKYLTAYGILLNPCILGNTYEEENPYSERDTETLKDEMLNIYEDSERLSDNDPAPFPFEKAYVAGGFYQLSRVESDFGKEKFLITEAKKHIGLTENRENSELRDRIGLTKYKCESEFNIVELKNALRNISF